MKHSGLITFLMISGLVLGALFGQYVLFNPDDLIPTNHWTKEVGTLILIRPLMMLIVPLVFVSVTLAMTTIGDPAKLGLLGGSTLLFYIVTMVCAATLGAIIVTTFRPGDLPPETRAAMTARAEADYTASDVVANVEQARKESKTSMGGAWMNLLQQLIPTNVVKDMAEGRTLGVIAFAILFGLALAVGGEPCRPAVAVLEAAFNAILRMISWVMWAAPVGVFLLVAASVGRVGLGALSGPLMWFMLIVIGGVATFGVVVLPAVLLIFGRTNPGRFAWQMRGALLTAFGTASSSATMPITMENCVTEGGCSRRATNFVVPLGATVNMNGTALFEAVAVIFLCQLYGIDLTFGEVLIVVMTAALAAIGAAGIPAAGLVTMVIVIGAVNKALVARGQPTLPESAIGVIIGVDRILDMCRTTLNVWGDMVGAKIMTRLAPDDVEEREKALS